MVLLALPLLLPLATAATALLLWRFPRVQQAVCVAGAGGLFAASLALLDSVRHQGIQALQVGSWPDPFGITLVADLFGAIMVVLAGLIGFAVMVYSVPSVDAPRKHFGYYPLLHVLLMGVCGAFLTGDLFNLYVWFEVLLIASFVLLALGGERAQLEGALKYVVLNLMSSALFLAGVGLLYGLAGTLSMADLAVKLRESSQPGLITTTGVFFLIAFGIKAAAFPLFFWLPASYHTPPVAVSAVFAGLLTKVGVYALIRVFTLLLTQDVAYTHGIILVVAGLTMLTGVLGAASQLEMRRILSFHIISQIGYMLMGLGLFAPLALAGSVFYIAHHIVVKTNLFLVSGLVLRLRGTDALVPLGGLYRSHPGVAALFAAPALALAGLPPLSGFFAKLVLIRSGLELERYASVAVALVVSVLTLFSMTKIWAEVFWKAPPPEASRPAEGRLPLAMLLPSVGLAAVTVWLGLRPEPWLQLATEAAGQLLSVDAYVAAVRGGTR